MTASSTPATATTPTSEARVFLSLAREILQQMAVLIRNSYLHDLTNEVFADPLEKAQTALKDVMAVEGSFRLERSGQEFYANSIRVRMEIRNLHAYKYVWNELEKRNLGGFNFESVPSVQELSQFLSVLAETRSATETDDKQINLALQEKGVTRIQALPPRPEEEEGPDEQSALDRRQRAIHAYEQVLDFIRESMTNLDSPAQINMRQAKRSVQRLVDLSYEEGEGFSLAGMAAIKSHDNYTFNHMVNVCVLAIAFGQRLGLKKQDLAQLGLCALYHDMGKLHIPLDVLNKHTSLTEEEWALMGNHTVYAARTLFPLIEQDHGTLHRILVALQHHYGVDGNGYPKLRLKQQQSFYAKIIAIVDTFDAMTTRRIYQRQFLPDEAMSILTKRSGKLYDPPLVKAFINCMGIFPVGSTVALTTDELAVVVESNPDPDRVHQPKVKVVTDVEKKLLVSAVLVDLSQPVEADRAIIKCVDPEPFGINGAHYVV
jgi:HD-GYP domain-containing protein (c-di-GMP phosphodiesterase class II)